MPSTTDQSSAGGDSIAAAAAAFDTALASERGVRQTAKPEKKAAAPNPAPQDEDDQDDDVDQDGLDDQDADAPQDDSDEQDDSDQEPDGDEEEDGDESEDSDEEAEDEDEEGEPSYRVRVAGKEIEVPLSELIQGYSRTADYTRKTQELAQVRQAVEQEGQQLRALRAQYAQRLNAVQQLLQQSEPQVDWDRLRAEDPIEFAAQWADHQRRQAALAQVQQQRAIVEQQQAQDTYVAEARQVEVARQQLPDLIPEWKDAKVAKAERAALKGFGRAYGYSDAELSEIVDPRAVVLLRMAYKYEQLKNRSRNLKPVKRTNTSAPKPKQPVLRPGAVESAGDCPRRGVF